MRPLPAMPKMRCGPALVRSTKRARLRRPALTWSSMTGTSVCNPRMPDGVAGERQVLRRGLDGVDVLMQCQQRHLLSGGDMEHVHALSRFRGQAQETLR